MNNYLVLDFECKDPYIKRKCGAGWVYLYNKVPNCDFKVLGCGYRLVRGEITEEKWLDFVNESNSSLAKLKAIIASVDKLIIHNALYDIGVLLALGIDLVTDPDSPKPLIIDTLILAKMKNNILDSYKLDALSKVYLKQNKTSDGLGNLIWELKLYEKNYKERPKQSALNLIAKSKMDVLYDMVPETVIDYCLQDVSLTDQLYRFLQAQENLYTTNEYNILLQAVIKSRSKGVRLDIEHLKNTHLDLIPKIKAAYEKCLELAGEFKVVDKKNNPKPFNPRSSTQCVQLFKFLGLSAVNSSKESLLNIGHPIGEALTDFRSLMKLDKDFILKLIKLQEFTCPDHKQYGRLYPEIVPFGADTGRFSSRDPNIQNMPARYPDLAQAIRSAFVAEEGEEFACLDYSRQEIVWQLHYAVEYKCEGAEEIKLQYIKDPFFDIYKYTADVANIPRDVAKMTNLTIVYGGGAKTISVRLSKSLEETKDIIEKFYIAAPYVKDLSNHLKDEAKNVGFTTIADNLRLYKPPKYLDKKTGEWKDPIYALLNYKIQGSSAAQTRKACIEAYKVNLPVLFMVHDEFNLSISSRKQAELMHQIMINVYKLHVPVVADVLYGKSWGEAKWSKA